MNKLLLGFLFLLFCNIAKAQPEILGSHISYKAIDSITYEVKLTVIRECSGNANEIKNTIEMHSGTYSVSQQANLISSRDITPTGKNCSEKSKCAGGKLYGFQERIYTTTFKLDKVKDCDVYFSWYGGNRYSYLSTVFNVDYHYNFAYLNYCASKINSSPVFTNTPRIITYEGQNSQVAIRALDTLEVNDSIVYEFNSPLTDTFVKLKYISPFWSNQFMTYLGAFRPNNDLRYPAGLFLDSITGNMSFRAMKKGEMTPYCIEANEYRNINGKVEKIGTIRWDMTFIVLSSPTNKTPSNLTIFDFKNPIDKFLCADIDNKFSFDSYDADATDSAHFKLDFSGYKNITFSDSFLNKDQTVYINWKTNQSQLRNINSPYLITLTVEDDNCDYNGVNSINIPFYFDKYSLPNFNLKDSLICNGKDASLELNLFNPGRMKSIVWNDTVLSDSFKINENDLPTSVKIKVTDTFGCSVEKIKNINKHTDYGIQFSLKDSLFCQGKDALLTLDVNNSNYVKEINWNNKISKDTFEVLSNEIPSNIEIKVTDINGCFETKTRFIDYFKRNPVVFYIKDSACFNDSAIILKSDINNGKWKGDAMIDSVFYPEKTNSENNEITFLFTDKNNCEDSAIKNIFIVKVPQPSLLIGSAKGDVPLTVLLSENSTTKFDSYFWEIKNDSHNFQLNKNNQTFIINYEGTYDVKLTVTYKGCSNSTEIKEAITVYPNILGIQNSLMEKPFIYPNPLNDKLIIEFSNEVKKATYQVLDVNGRVILKGDLKNTKTLIQMDNLMPGFYFMEVMDDGNLPISKIKLIKY